MGAGTRLAVALTLLLALANAEAQTDDIPDGVLAAEMAQDWQRAADGLRAGLAEQPNRRDWWLRLSQVLAAQQAYAASAEALVQAAEVGAPSAALHAQASAALATANQPEAALAQIQKARALDPEDASLVWREINLANWAGQTELASQRLRTLWEQGSRGSRLGFLYGENLAWQGDTDQAYGVLLEHLDHHPKDTKALLLTAQIASWRGDYQASVELLDRFDDAGGDSDVYRTEKAAILGWADRPFAALALLDDVRETPETQSRHTYAEAIALRRAHRNAAALVRIEALQTARQDGLVDADGLATYLTTDLRDHIEFSSIASQDSDEIAIWRNHLSGTWWPGANLSASAALDWDHYEVDVANGLQADPAQAKPEALGISAGLDWYAGSRWRLTVSAGHTSVDQAKHDGLLTGALALTYRASDSLRLRASGDRALHGVSPRAVDRGIGRNEYALSMNWHPDLRWTVDARIATADFFSSSDCAACKDSNRRQQWSFGAQRGLLYGQHWNMSLGPFISMTRFDDDLDNGYYDPDRFDNIALASNIYFGIDLDTGFALSASLGVQRDHAIADEYTPAASLSTVTTIGIWADTMIKIRLAGSYGVSRGSDDYSAIQAGISLVRRF